MSSVRYLNKCYKLLRNLDESGRITWASKVKNLLFRNGFGYVWHVEDVGDQTLFMKTVKQRLINKHDWSTVIAESGKTRHYRFIMPELKVANYIKYDIPLKFRISLSKLRCSVHNLNVETGRQRGFIYEQRLCML